jgi:hypothetical protein
MRKVRINQGRIVPFQFRIVVTALIFFGMAGALLNLSQMPAIGICILLGTFMPVVWSMYYILEIDPESKTISEITWIAGFQKPKRTPFESIEKIFINETRQQQQMTSWAGQVRTSRFKELVAYLKLEDGRKFYLLSAADAVDMRSKIEPLSKKLDCQVVENF